jgi:uncharacterized protein YkwD
LALAAGPSLADSLDRPLADLERRTAAAVDAHRRQAGLDALAWSDGIAEQARAHSEAMAAGKAGFGHDGFQARADAIAGTLRLAKAAENIFRSSPGDEDLSALALARWRGSSAHRKNMQGDFAITGVGAARAADGEIFLTQIFVALRPHQDKTP